MASIDDHIVPKDQLAFSEDLSGFKNLIVDPTEEMGDLYYNDLREQLYDAEKLNSNFKKKIIYTVYFNLCLVIETGSIYQNVNKKGQNRMALLI